MRLQLAGVTVGEEERARWCSLEGSSAQSIEAGEVKVTSVGLIVWFPQLLLLFLLLFFVFCFFS